MTAYVVRPVSSAREVEIVVPIEALRDVLVHIGLEVAEDGSDLREALDDLRAAQTWVDETPAGVDFDRAVNTRDEALHRMGDVLGPVVWRVPADDAHADLVPRVERASLEATGYVECASGLCDRWLHRRDATETGCCSDACDANAQERQGARG